MIDGICDSYAFMVHAGMRDDMRAMMRLFTESYDTLQHTSPVASE